MRKNSSEVLYNLDKDGYFTIENYNKSKIFSNFFPGIAGVWGIPMWVFYVNRGQCITSFGIESKDKSIMEFQPANKAYRTTSLQGFRTFIKLSNGKNEFYWEPFQENLIGTIFNKKQIMSISSQDLTIEEINYDLGIKIKINYFTLPDEAYSALVRRITITNIGLKKYNIELIDGLPLINPFGIKDWVAKNMSRTAEAWIKVRNLNNKAPFYHLNVDISDTSEVTHIKEGNFFFSYVSGKKSKKQLEPIVETSLVFGDATDFAAPARFLSKQFTINKSQQTNNRTPCAMSYYSSVINKNDELNIASLVGYAHEESQVNQTLKTAISDGFIEEKALRNKEIIDEIKNYAFTKSSSKEFDLYSGQTFLDNVMRGGLPVSLKTSDGNITINVFSRKHGDIERDYNFFTVAPTYYSQGNGNYRDVNQNRRNDVWFNTNIKDSYLINFMNLIQADGYNPLIVKGTTFSVEDNVKLKFILESSVKPDFIEDVENFLKNSFMPGELLTFIDQKEIELKIDSKLFLCRVLEICHKHESSDHGEGFWSDHWTYNMDLIESFLAIYPEKLNSMLLDKKVFYFYHNDHYVLPRDQRYILTSRGVRQYKSVKSAKKEIDAAATGHKLRIDHGKGEVYKATMICKLLCLIANKVATLDPSGIGIEMEADKPNWYDALNGLPGLLGSSISETFELKRLSLFLLESLKKLNLNDDLEISVFEELGTFMSGLSNVLSLEADPLYYWMKSNDIKEKYRVSIRKGIDGEETLISISEIKDFLELVIAKTEKAAQIARNEKGFLLTYFFHEVTKYQSLDKKRENADSSNFVMPTNFKRHSLPLFLEGNVHALKCEQDLKRKRSIYLKIKESDLFDKSLKMYKVNTELSKETEEIGRASSFPRGWLENESIWLHMEYKLMLELLRGELYEEFYENFKNVFIPFLKPEIYGRNILENSSFLVSSAHDDKNLHGQGFVARLSGSTAEFLHIWLYMNIGKDPFVLNAENELIFQLNPVLPSWMFTKEKSLFKFYDINKKLQTVELPKNSYSFNFLGSTLVIYNNEKRLNTFGEKRGSISKIKLFYNNKKSVVINSSKITQPYSSDIREHKICRIEAYIN